MEYSSLLATIDANIRANGNEEITGLVLNGVLRSMVSALGNGFQFKGIAQPGDNPGTPDAKVFYLATTPGQYANFGGATVTTGQIVALSFDTSWHADVLITAASLHGSSSEDFAAKVMHAFQVISDTSVIGKEVVGETVAGDKLTLHNSENEALTDIVPGGQSEDVEVVMPSKSGTLALQEDVDEAVSQLGQKVDENIDGESNITKEFVWQDGAVANTGAIVASTVSKFCQPILFKKGEKLTYRNTGTLNNAVVSTADDSPLSIGSHDFISAHLIIASANKEYSIIFDEDTYVVITINKTQGQLSVSKTSKTLVKHSGFKEIPIGANILQPEQIFRESFYIRRTDGFTQQTGGYGFTDFIPIPPEGLMGYKMLPLAGTYATPALLYDANKKFVRLADSAVPPANDVAYARFNLGNPANLAEGENYAVFKGTKTALYSDAVNPQQSISGDIIQESSISLASMTDVSSKNLIKQVWQGVYFGAGSGSYHNNPSYDATDKIKVKPNTNYVVNSSVKTVDGVVLFDSSGIITRTLTSMAFTTASNEVMVVITFNAVASAEYMLEEGTVASEYAPYKLQFNEDVIPYKEIPDGSVTQSKIAPGVSLPSTPNPFNSVVSTGEIAAGETLTATSILISNRQVLSAEIIGTVEDVLVGVGLENLYGCWLQITPTQVKVVYGSSSTVAATYSHGLTLGTRTKVIIERGGELSFHLINDAGGMYSNAIRHFVGTPFIKNNGVSTISASLRYGSRMASARIWCAGDSYWSFNDPARIPYNLSALGVNEILVVARGGESAGGILPSIQALVESGGRPSYIVWALGMNGGTDTDGQVNPTWMAAVNTFLALCNNTGITPIFCTIPTVPTASHDALNAWIRNIGYRYIDVATEVEQNGTNTWRGWGTEDALLSPDQVHPSQAGALQIASRIIVEFPEITQLNP